MADEANEFGSGTFGSQFGAEVSGGFKSLIDDCLRAVGVVTTDSKYRSRALTMLTHVQTNALKGRNWKFLNRELYIDLQAPYTSGTVALTQGSDTVREDVALATVPLISWNVTHKGAKFAFEGEEYTSRILDVPDNKTLELASKYPNTSANLKNYKILFDRENLDVKIHKVKSVSINGIGEIKPTGLEKFRRMEAENPTRTGFPEYYTLTHTEEDSGQLRIEFYPAPDKRYSARVEYTETVTRPEDSETCFSVIPPDHIDVLYYGAVTELYVFQNNASMAQIMSTRYQDSWRRFASDQDMVDSVARMQHGRKYFSRRHRYRGYYGLSWFGKVED